MLSLQLRNGLLSARMFGSGQRCNSFLIYFHLVSVCRFGLSSGGMSALVSSPSLRAL
jgi:hypothetical protein